MSSERIEYKGIVATFHKRADRKSIQARFYGDGFVNTGKVWNTKQTDMDAAMEAARDYIHEHFALKKHGINSQSKTFGDVAEAWASQYTHKDPKQQRDYRNVANRYLCEYFADKKIDNVKARDIKAYHAWRVKYWTDGPGKDIDYIYFERNGKDAKRPAQHKKTSTARLRIEDVVLRHVFKFAVMNEWLKHSQIPMWDSPHKQSKKDPNARVSFTKKQMTNVLRQINGSRSETLTRRHHERNLLYMFVRFALATGARPPHEILGVKWSDITDFTYGDAKTVQVFISDSKTGKRPVVARPYLKPRLEWWRQYTKFNADNDYVFTKWNGEQLRDPRKAFDNMLVAAGATHNKGKKLSMYSMRHTYITFALAAGVNVYNIATQCGTSVEMIERYYSDVTRPG
ncbi:tyrosine-type recombinase/integrase [Magnetovibrio blakemorei]|nr:site-specific integrase [Magnetovibrio blakemorei]